MPVGMYPPNSLGLYDFAMNGFEWMVDWYHKDFYKRSPVQDPVGAPTGLKKAIRGLVNGQTHPAMTFHRKAREPQLVDSPTNVSNNGYGFRCVSRAATP